MAKRFGVRRASLTVNVFIGSGAETFRGLLIPERKISSLGDYFQQVVGIVAAIPGLPVFKAKICMPQLSCSCRYKTLRYRLRFLFRNVLQQNCTVNEFLALLPSSMLTRAESYFVWED